MSRRNESNDEHLNPRQEETGQDQILTQNEGSNMECQEDDEPSSEDLEPLTQDEASNKDYKNEQELSDEKLLTQDEQEIRRFELRTEEFEDDYDHPDEAYCFTANEA